MSTRDEASLSAQERAALASLEAKAAADDPQLAARLKGRPHLELLARVAVVPAWMRSRWWGVLVAVAGLAIIALSMSVGFGLGLVGVALTAIGLWLVVGAVERRLQRAVEHHLRKSESG